MYKQTRNKANFLTDLITKCLAIKKHCENTEKLAKLLRYATDFIMDCYTGICARTYVEHSILCKGHPGKPPTSCQESLSYEGGQGYYT